MFIRAIEMKIDKMKRDVEREGRREERRKEFEKRTGLKLEDEELEKQPSPIEFILKRHPSLMEDGFSPNTNNASAGPRSPPPTAGLQVPSPGGTDGPPQSPGYRSRRFSLFGRRGDASATPGGHGGHAADGSPTGAIDLEMGPVETGNRLIDRRARGERGYPVIDEEQRIRASQEGVRDGFRR